MNDTLAVGTVAVNVFIYSLYQDRGENSALQHPPEHQIFLSAQAGVNVAARIIYIIGEINEAMAARVIPALYFLDQSEGEIRIVIDSEGGNECDGYAIHDAITMCKNKVIADVYGQCLSIAAAILQAADTRRMAPYADFLIHNGSIGADQEMKQDDIIDLADQIKRDSQKYYDILSAASQHTQDTIEAWCREEKYFNAKEAKEAGFCDELIKPQKIRNRPRRKRRQRS